MKAKLKTLLGIKTGTKSKKIDQVTEEASHHRLFETGRLRVEAQFWDCYFDYTHQTVDVVRKDVMGELEIDVLQNDKTEDLIWKAVKEINKEILSDYLKQRELFQFIPTKIPTWDKQDNTMQICYYHSVNVYEKKWGNYTSKGIIEQATDPHLLRKLEQLCQYYSLDPSEYI